MQSAKFKVFIGGLSYETTDESLAEYFKQFGPVQKAIVMRNPQGQSRGFGFCVFQQKESFDQVLQKKSHTIDNRCVDVREALSKGDAPPPQANDGATKLNDCKLFVGGLHYQTTQQDLYEYFKHYGAIESTTVVYNHENKKSRGFGFVIFHDISSVRKVREVSKHVIMGREVEVKAATPKSDGHVPPVESIQEPEPDRTLLDRSLWETNFSAYSDPISIHSFSQIRTPDFYSLHTSYPLSSAFSTSELRSDSILYNHGHPSHSYCDWGYDMNYPDLMRSY